MESTASAPFERQIPRVAPLRRRWLLRAGSIALTLLIVGAWFQLLRPSSIGGPATYVIVSGTSMLPTLESKDLAAAFREDSYEVGDIVVYRVPAADPGAGVNIVHRIVGGSPRRGYIVKGDNREGADYWRPKTDEILGKVRLHVPRGGVLLLFMRSSVGLALLAGLTTLVVALSLMPRGQTKRSRKPLKSAARGSDTSSDERSGRN